MNRLPGTPGIVRSTFVLTCLMLATPVAFGQDAAASQPVDAAGAKRPAAAQPIAARVIEVHGDVQHAPVQSRDWQACKVDEEYPEQTKIRTGLRSSIKFQIGDEEPYTALLIESVGLTVLSEARKTADTKRVRVGVSYGKIRAGVAEGGLKSDFTVDSPVATLSKRGTWNFALAYERATDRFEISLLDRGLVEALDKLRGRRREVLPGQAVTQAMRRWLDEAQIRRNVAVSDILGQEHVEIAFNRIRQDGLGVLGIGSGQVNMLNLSTPTARTQFNDIVQRVMQNSPLPRLAPPGPPARPEGFFGTGRGDDLIRVVIEASNPLAQRELVRPGTYVFRRAALEHWLRVYRGQP